MHDSFQEEGGKRNSVNGLFVWYLGLLGGGDVVLCWFILCKTCALFCDSQMIGFLSRCINFGVRVCGGCCILFRDVLVLQLTY